MLAFAVAPALADKPPTADSSWRQIDKLSSVFGFDGKVHTPTCSGYPLTDSSFRFWARGGASKNLVVYFEGGGACWDNLTCTFPLAGLPPDVPQFYSASISPATNPAALDGIFSASNPANPVKDWNFVYIPYCTGDVHIGSATRTYANAGHPVFTYLPGSFDIRHRGFDNFMVVLDWMKKHVGNPERVLVAGSSAGGYGASANFPWIQRAFPRSKLSVLADASDGVSTPAFDQGTPGRGSWNPQLARWIFGSDPSRVASSDYLRIGAKASPETRVGQFTTTFDATQIQVYGLLRQYYGPAGTCQDSALDWNRQAMGTLRATAAAAPNFRHYVAQGSYHTILTSAQFYAENSAGVGFSDWVSAMLDPNDGRVRFDAEGWLDWRNGGGWRPKPSAWQNVACPDCLNPAPCP